MAESMNHTVNHEGPSRGAVVATGGKERDTAPSEWPEVPEAEPGLRRPWAWYAGGVLLLMGGLLQAISAGLFLWATIDDPSLGLVESDFLWVPRPGPDVHWSWDVAVAGCALTAAAFIALTALPWRGRGVLPRLGLVWGAWAFGAPALYLLIPGAAYVPETSGNSMLVAVSTMLWMLSPAYLWAMGVVPIVLFAAASYPPFLVRRAPLLLIVAFALLMLTAPLITWMIPLPISSNFEPPGFGVLSGPALATSGALLLIVARLNAKE